MLMKTLRKKVFATVDQKLIVDFTLAVGKKYFFDPDLIPDLKVSKSFECKWIKKIKNLNNNYICTVFVVEH